MTAYNVVRFRVKPGMEEAFIASQRKSIEGDADMPGSLSAALVKTGERQYCFVGRWADYDSIVAARPQMISFLNEVREYLEDLGGGLGVTDPASGVAVVERTT
jgi:quinol monooxygenase YgiN